MIPPDGGWKWIGESVAIAAYEALLAEFGGPSGILNADALHSALARPRNLFAYAAADPAALAAAYAYGLIRNHPFADGNKRTGYALALVFLLDNGFVFTGADAESVEVMLGVAAGTVTEDELTAWFTTHIRSQP